MMDSVEFDLCVKYSLKKSYKVRINVNELSDKKEGNKVTNREIK